MTLDAIRGLLGIKTPRRKHVKASRLSREYVLREYRSLVGLGRGEFGEIKRRRRQLRRALCAQRFTP